MATRGGKGDERGFVLSLRRAPAEGERRRWTGPENTALSPLISVDEYRLSCPDAYCHYTGGPAGSLRVTFLCELSTVQSTHCAVLEKCPACR